MTTASTTGLWLTLTYRDADAAIGWLTAVGFTEHAVHRDGDLVAHAEMLWPAGGGVMLGSHREGNDWDKRPGTGAAYLVTDDPDGFHRAALQAGGASLREPADVDYGGRTGIVTDPEGNLWSYGSYQPS